MMKRLCVAAALVVAAVATACPSTRAAGDGSVLIGRWVGLSQEGELEPTRSVLELTGVKNRRLQGTLEIIPCVFPVDITLSAAGIVNGVGREEDGDRVQLHGQLALMGDGSVRTLALSFKVFEADGSVKPGFALLTQTAAHPGEVNLDVFRELEYSRSIGPGGGCLEMSLGFADPRTEPTGLVGGTGLFEDYPLGRATGDLAFDLLGSVGLPAVQKGGSQFILIGLSQPSEAQPRGIIAILIGLLLPAVQDQPGSLAGEYLFFGSLQDAYQFLTRGSGPVLDRGTFQLPAVQ